jgi:hypothetical protein
MVTLIGPGATSKLTKPRLLSPTATGLEPIVPSPMIVMSALRPSASLASKYIGFELVLPFSVSQRTSSWRNFPFFAGGA